MTEEGDVQTYRFEDSTASDFDAHVCTVIPLNNNEVRITSSRKSANFQHDLHGFTGTLITDMNAGDSTVIERFIGKTSYGINSHVPSFRLSEDDGNKVLIIKYEKIVADVVQPKGEDDFFEHIPTERHPASIVNVLYHGGHVKSVQITDIDPTVLENHNQWWISNRFLR